MPVSETGALTIWRHPNKMAGIGRLEHPRAVLETAALPVKLYPCMMMVMPAGLEPSITSLRGLRPDQLDEGTILEIRVGFEPTINSFAGCPLQPLEYRIMAGIVGFEPTVPASKAGALAAWPYPSIIPYTGKESPRTGYPLCERNIRTSMKSLRTGRNQEFSRWSNWPSHEE